MEPTRIKWGFVALLVISVGVTAWLQFGTDADPRLVSALYGFAAMAGLTYRLITTWGEVTVLIHVLALALLGFLLIGAIGSLQLSGHAGGTRAPLTVVSWPAAYLRVACVLIAVKWPRWANRRTSAFRDAKDPAA